MDKILVLGAIAGGFYFYDQSRRRQIMADAFYRILNSTPQHLQDALASKDDHDYISGDEKPRPSEYPYLDASIKFANSPIYENVAVERIYYEPNSLNGAVKETVELYGTRYVSRGVNYEKYRIK